jgi:3-hydroxyisobutyrate dehydrogenase-like beta-hydroxyacid dehydrogenase
MTWIDDTVGQIGVGAIGRIYARHLVAGGHELVVFDRDQRALDELGLEVTVEASPSELAARCGIVVLALPDPRAVEQVMFGDGGVLTGARAGTIVVDLSTVGPGTSRAIHARASERGVHYLDAPVSGGKPMSCGVEGAEAGNVTFMVGGDAEAFADARPVMELLGEVFLHVGPSGAGSTVKIISNLLSGVYTLVAAEAFALGARAGFTPAQLLEVLRETDGRSFFMTDYLVPRFERDELDPGFSIELQLKDHRLAAELAHELEVPLPFNAIAIQLYELMRAHGLGGRDVSAALPFASSAVKTELVRSEAVA